MIVKQLLVPRWLDPAPQIPVAADVQSAHSSEVATRRRFASLPWGNHFQKNHNPESGCLNRSSLAPHKIPRSRRRPVGANFYWSTYFRADSTSTSLFTSASLPPSRTRRVTVTFVFVNGLLAWTTKLKVVLESGANGGRSFVPPIIQRVS